MSLGSQNQSSDDESHQPFLCPFCRRERFSLERDLRYHQASCPHALHNRDNLTSTPESINGNGEPSSLVLLQPSSQDPIYREGTSDSGTAPDHIRGGQNAFQSTSSLSRSNGVGGSGPTHTLNITAAHRSALTLPAPAAPAGLPATRTPELLTLHLRSSDQPITGSTRYTVWENVIEMPRNVPYPSLSNMRYTITPHSRMSQVDIPDEDGENDYDGDDDDETADDAAEGSSDV